MIVDQRVGFVASVLRFLASLRAKQPTECT
jgi:hypothetical protein